MAERAIWEERLHASDVPLPRRHADDADPLRGRRQWTEPGLPLLVWASFALAPAPHGWELTADDQAVYLQRNGVVRVGLVDVHRGLIVEWRRTAGSRAYAPRQPRAAPEVHPLDRRRSRRRTPPDASPGRFA